MRWKNQKGLSLIELLIAMALFLVIAIGTLPLMMRSIADRNRGWEATKASSFAQSKIEPLLAIELDSDALTLRSGAKEKLTTQFWTEGHSAQTGDALEGWADSTATAGRGRVVWHRNTYVRWYNLADLENPVDGSTDTQSVPLKEIQVQITGVRKGGGLGAGQNLWIRVFKAF